MPRLWIFLVLAPALFAQKKPVTLEALEESGRAVREAPGPPIWAPDGQSFAFEQARELKLYTPSAKSTKTLLSLQGLDAAALRPSDDGPAEWTDRRTNTGGIGWSADGKSLLYTANGDIFWIHADTGTWDQLTKTPAAEIDAKFSPDSKMIAFRRGSDLYALQLDTRKETRLTTNGTPTLINGGPDWVYPEELELGTAFWWSPDSRSIAYLQFDTSREPVYPHEDLLKVRALYEPERYPQAGENNPDVRLQNKLAAMAIDVESGAASTLFEESDRYWIDLAGDLLFLKDGRFLWTSERDGFRHIYLYSADGKDVKQLTQGAWEVGGIEGVDERAGTVFYVSSEPTHLERHLYSVGLDGKNKQRLTKEAGTHSVSMAPNGAYYVDTLSTLTAPPRALVRAESGEEVSVYREANRRVIDQYQILPTEIVSFQGADGTALYGRLVKPAGYQSGKRYPVVVQVYGGPGVTLPVRNAWSGLSLDQVLAHRGYVVWQAENRGGPGRGHAFETAIYHQLGVNELADQVAGVKHLIAMGIADPDRIGIRGCSYGGFMTLNALLNAPDVFRAGFAGAPVTDWRNYDTIYTERYMGLPAENHEGYQKTALTARAAALKGKLLLVHNFEDDNVLFQNSLQMTNALQQADKQFEFMLYPQKTHGVTGKLSNQMNRLAVEFFDRSLK